MDVLLEGFSATEATTTPVVFTPTAGRTVFVAAVAPATITAPFPWVTVDFEVSSQGAGIWMLPAAEVTGAQVTLVLTHNGPRQCAFVVWEDDVDTTDGPPVMVSGLAESASQTQAGVVTPATTTSGRDIAVAVFALTFGAGNGTAYAPVSAGQGFTVAADSDTAITTNEGTRLVLATLAAPTLTAQAVTLTCAVSQSRTPTTGVLVYDQGVGGGGDTPTTTDLTATPASGADTATQVDLTATVTPSGAAGSVEFRDGSTLIGTVAVSGGVATLADHVFSVAGTRTVRADFIGATGWGDSFGTLSYGVSGGSGGQIDYDPPAARRTIAQENALTGAASSQWEISGAGDLTNQGFVRDFSVQVGQIAQFAVTGDCEVIDVYRIGWYGGLGWRRVATLENTPTAQPGEQSIADSNGGTDCDNWSTTTQWDIPDFHTPGLHVAVIRNAALNNASWAPFMVVDPARSGAIVYKTSDTTWALAYNRYRTSGTSRVNGSSFYTNAGGGLWNITGRAHAASYNRPITTREEIPQTYWLACEAPLIRWLERNGFDLNYISCRELDAGLLASLPGAQALISSGHDEYWSQGMRGNAEAFRDAGNHLVFMSANEVFWRIRFTATGSRQRTTAYCYKDTMPGPDAHTAGTPLDPVSWTGTWKDTRWAQREPENLLTGTDFRMNGINDLDVLIDASEVGTHPLWRGTPVASGTDATLVDVVGFEADQARPTRPPAEFKLAASRVIPINGSYADDDGENYEGLGSLDPWGIVCQLYPSGGLVVGFGTCQWSWALDSTHDRIGGSVSEVAQQASLNLLRDLGGTPLTVQSGLTTQAPVSPSLYAVDPPASPPPTPPTPPTPPPTTVLATTVARPTVVGGQATLRATYTTVEGDPIDPTGVAVNVRAPDGTITTTAPVQESTGVYTHVITITQVGVWKWRFTAVGVATHGSLRAVDPFAPGAEDYVTIGDIETALGRTLTPQERTRARQLIVQVVTTLEGWLRRDLVARSYTNERKIITPVGHLIPSRAEVAPGSLVVDAVPDTPVIGGSSRWWEATWTPGSVVYIDYDTLGHDGAVGAVVDVVAATIDAPQQVASGVIAAYAVEGTSITYGPVAVSDTSTGRIPVGGVRAIQHLRIPNYRP